MNKIYQQIDSQGFHIGTSANGADWPGAIDASAPEYDREKSLAMWDVDHWVIKEKQELSLEKTEVIPGDRADVEHQRLSAYANPLTGSDRHFAEAARLEAVGDTEGAELARAAGLARYDEIRTMYPWPEEA